MADRPDEYGYNAWSGTGVGTNAGVSVSHTTQTGGNVPYCTGIQGSGDAAALVTIESPASTILWKKRFTAAFTFSEFFTTPIPGTRGAAMVVKISASTANCEANSQGYDAP